MTGERGGGVLQRIIHYRAVEWFNEDEDLVELLRQTLNQRPSVNATAFPMQGHVVAP